MFRRFILLTSYCNLYKTCCYMTWRGTVGEMICGSGYDVGNRMKLRPSACTFALPQKRHFSSPNASSLETFKVLLCRVYSPQTYSFFLVLLVIFIALLNDGVVMVITLLFVAFLSHTFVGGVIVAVRVRIIGRSRTLGVDMTRIQRYPRVVILSSFLLSRKGQSSLHGHLEGRREVRIESRSFHLLSQLRPSLRRIGGRARRRVRALGNRLIQGRRQRRRWC